jgi:WD40 repeat protein
MKAVTWSPDVSKLTTCGDAGIIVWDARTGHQVLTLRRHHGSVENVEWSPDGKRLASSGYDDRIQVYAIDQSMLLHLVRSRVTRSLTGDECAKYFNSRVCPPLPEIP